LGCILIRFREIRYNSTEDQEINKNLSPTLSNLFCWASDFVHIFIRISHFIFSYKYYNFKRQRERLSKDHFKLGFYSSLVFFSCNFCFHLCNSEERRVSWENESEDCTESDTGVSCLSLLYRYFFEPKVTFLYSSFSSTFLLLLFGFDDNPSESNSIGIDLP